MHVTHQCLETVFDFSLLAYLINQNCHCALYILYSQCHIALLNFEGPCLGYGFLSIIFVLEKCIFTSLKVTEKSLNFVLCVCYEPCYSPFKQLQDHGHGASVSHSYRFTSQLSPVPIYTAW